MWAPGTRKPCSISRANRSRSRAVEADLKSLKKALAESKDLRVLVGSPAFGADDKAKGLAAVAVKAKFNPTTRKFLGLLAANGRAAALGAVIAGFEELSAKARGAVSAQVTHRHPAQRRPVPGRRRRAPPGARQGP